MRAEPIFPIRRLWPSIWPRFALIAGLGAAALGYAALNRFAQTHAFMLNLSPSLPHWALWLEHGRVPRRNEILVFMPPRSALMAAHFGEHARPFAKYAVGLPGDRVTRAGRQFFVNGRLASLAKTATRRGEPLALGPTGTLPPGCYFVATPHRDSFDSRYAAIGWICNSRILGTARPIL